MSTSAVSSSPLPCWHEAHDCACHHMSDRTLLHSPGSCTKQQCALFFCLCRQLQFGLKYFLGSGIAIVLILALQVGRIAAVILPPLVPLWPSDLW